MKIALCDDDKQSLNEYRTKLEEQCKKHKIQAFFVTYESAKQLLFEVEDPETRPDILYLDINMPGMDGITVAEELRKRNLQMEIVFLTVSKEQEHWQRAFDIDATNYLIKGHTEERFEKVFLSALEKAEKNSAEMIMLNRAGQTRSINIKNIYYFESQRNILTVHYIVGEIKKKFEFYSTISRMENVLWGKGFIKCHRSFLVNINMIDEIQDRDIILADGRAIPIGKTQKTAVAEACRFAG